MAAVGLIRTDANVELTFAVRQVVDGVFEPGERESSIIVKELAELATLAGALTQLRRSML